MREASVLPALFLTLLLTGPVPVFTRAQVTPDMAAMTLVVVAYPEAPTTETLPLATMAGPGVRAVFAYEDFAKIHLGDFEVVVLAGQAERACTIDAAARASIKYFSVRPN